MLRFALRPALLTTLVLSATPCVAQDIPATQAAPMEAAPVQPPSLPAAPAPVQVTTLAAPDAFSTAGRYTGLGPDLWRDTPAGTARAVLALVAAKPLSPATAALARRVLATGAPGPAGLADETGELAGARAQALMTQGDLRAAVAILDRAPAVSRSAALSRAAAEAALLNGDDQRACAVGQALSVGRDDIYWLRLRAYCQALAGDRAAHLTLELAQTQARDATFGRLMAAKLAGAGDPGAPSGRNGLDYALSRSLGLDVGAAKPAPMVAAALAGGDPAAPAWTVAPEASYAAAAAFLAGGAPIPAEETERLIAQAATTSDAKARAKAEGAAVLAAATAVSLTPAAREALATFRTAAPKAGAGRLLALEMAAQGRRTGETALVAIWIAADAGTEGPAPGDRAAVIRALTQAGLEADARQFALEGLADLR